MASSGLLCRARSRGSRSSLALLAAVLFAILPLLAAPSRADEKWAPIDPRDLSAMKGSVDPTADAEWIFSDIRVEDTGDENSLHSDVSRYVRVKVFTTRGVESLSHIDLPYDKETKIVDLAARMIRTDGSIVDIDRRAVFDREIAKASGLKVRMKSLAVPSLVVGSILDYRWTERRYEAMADNLTLDLQSEFPIRSTTLWVKPLTIPGVPLRFRLRAFNMQLPRFEEAPDGFARAIIPAMPAFRDEPYMPAPENVRAHVRLYYQLGEPREVQEEWDEWGAAMYDAYHDRLRADDTVERAAREVIAGAASNDDRLDRLDAFCRTRITNTSATAFGRALQADAGGKPKRPAETLRQGSGSATDINCLFVAMAAAVGFRAKIGLVADRSSHAFIRKDFTPGLLDQLCVAAWNDGYWRFLDPGAPFAGAGTISWWKEGEEALLLDPRKAEFSPTPIAPPESSLTRRIALLALSTDGTLEGEVREEFTGHSGASRRASGVDRSPVERDKDIRDGIQSRLSGAEVSAVRLEHVLDREGPYTVSFHVRVRGYAQRVGKRLVFEPSFFEQGSSPDFPASERKFPVAFAYPWSVLDSVVIRLPDSLAVEGAASTEPLYLGPAAEYRVSLTPSEDGRSLCYRRSFVFGRDGAINFPVEQYSNLKRAFEACAERDGLSVSLVAQGAGE